MPPKKKMIVSSTDPFGSLKSSSEFKGLSKSQRTMLEMSRVMSSNPNASRKSKLRKSREKVRMGLNRRCAQAYQPYPLTLRFAPCCRRSPLYPKDGKGLRDSWERLSQPEAVRKSSEHGEWKEE